jgi:hypothetical protein
VPVEKVDEFAPLVMLGDGKGGAAFDVFGFWIGFAIQEELHEPCVVSCGGEVKGSHTVLLCGDDVSSVFEE